MSTSVCCAVPNNVRTVLDCPCEHSNRNYSKIDSNSCDKHSIFYVRCHLELDPCLYLLPLALPTLVPAPNQGFPSSRAGSHVGILFLHNLGNRSSNENFILRLKSVLILTDKIFYKTNITGRENLNGYGWTKLQVCVIYKIKYVTGCGDSRSAKAGKQASDDSIKQFSIQLHTVHIGWR